MANKKIKKILATLTATSLVMSLAGGQVWALGHL